MTLALELTVFDKLFAGVAEEMGIVLRRSAFSPNIKERRDYSAAVFTARGELLAQAAHIPVHLGALPLTMAKVLAEYPPLNDGDILMLNDPYWGGTHLPDITLIAPHSVDGAGPRFYVVNRAHHADVGGATPASMPLADDLRQEGVIIPPTLLYRQGILEQDFLDHLIQQMRAPQERRGDLAAQIAALHRGRRRLADLINRYGTSKLEAMSIALLSYSERAMRALIKAIPDGHYTCTDYLDDDGYGHLDLPLTVTLIVQGEIVVLDFRECTPQTQGGVNTVPAVVQAACYYVFLALLAEEYPINQGCFRPVQGTHPARHPGGRSVPRGRGCRQCGDLPAPGGCGPGGSIPSPARGHPGGQPGDHEQPGFRRQAIRGGGFYVLRDHRRRHGRLSGQTWSGRGPHPYDQHPEHSRRSAGAGVSVAR